MRLRGEGRGKERGKVRKRIWTRKTQEMRKKGKNHLRQSNSNQTKRKEKVFLFGYHHSNIIYRFLNPVGVIY